VSPTATSPRAFLGDALHTPWRGHLEFLPDALIEVDPAGSGAYKVSNWTAGTQVVFDRNDSWTGGPLPKVKRIVWRMVPSAGNRRALLERGDADISYDLPNKDFVELKDAGKLTPAQVSLAKWNNARAAIEVARARAIREVIGPDIKLMCDINQRWRVEQAIDIIAEARVFAHHTNARDAQATGIEKLRIVCFDVPLG